MTFYRQMGNIPRKRHTMFRKADGSLYREQVMGTKGFSGVQSILYHHHAPTAMAKAELVGSAMHEYEEQGPLCHRNESS
jgi:homogentisate 1,2-dioxygenase